MNIRALLSGVAIAGAASLFAAPSFAVLDDYGCYSAGLTISPSNAGVVCADVQLNSANGGTPYVSSPLPDAAQGPVSASGGVGGTGGGASASASGDFGEVHLSASSFHGVSQDPIGATGIAWVGFSDALYAADTVTATITVSADGVFTNNGSADLLFLLWG